MASNILCESINHVQQLQSFLSQGRESRRPVFLELYSQQQPKVAVKGKSPPLMQEKKKKSSKDTKEKEPSEENLDLQPPNLEVQSNASSFAVYSSIRQVILERETLTRQFIQTKVGEGDLGKAKEEDKQINSSNLPKVVGFGLRSVFELIRETRSSHPGFCARSLKALLDMLQGLVPEELASEPADIIDALFYLLLDFTTNQSAGDSEELVGLAAAALISLIIAKGETGKLLAGVSALLMRGHRLPLQSDLPLQSIKKPSIVSSLQQSILSVSVGKTSFPDWKDVGIPKNSLVHSFHVLHNFSDSSTHSSLPCAIASIGSFAFIHGSFGLLKVGTGYDKTLKGYVYASNESFYNDGPGWLGAIRGKLYFYPSRDVSGPSSSSNSLVVVDSTTLTESKKIELPGCSDYEQLFTDGATLGRLSASSGETFAVKFYNLESALLTPCGEMETQLAKKKLILSDYLPPGISKNGNRTEDIDPTLESDMAYLGVGKEFTICRVKSGKIFLAGKGQSLGMKHSSPSKGINKWTELTLSKASSFSDCSVWHEGQPAVFLAQDGHAYLCLSGHAEIGEQGRRVAKSSKPIKLQGLEGKTPVQCSCNNGTTAVVTAEGELFLFGKLFPYRDDQEADQLPGLVTCLKDVRMKQVSLGKAHGCAITDTGQVYTFGVNSKGQCGRGAASVDIGKDGEKNEMIVGDAEDEFEEDEKDKVEDACDHDWLQSDCLICSQCGECTGYGAQCINSTLPGRRPGMLCGCGAGDAGCSKCGACRTCVGEPNAARGGAQARPMGALLRRRHDVLSRIESMMRNKPNMRNMAWLNDLDKNKDENNASGDEQKEADKSTSKPPMLSPDGITIHPDKIPATQVACGLHHSVVLFENGEVYVFGSGSYGQTGQGNSHSQNSAVKVSVAEKVSQIAVGSNHTVLLTTCGKVYTFGRNQKGQLCRPVPEESDDLEGVSSSLPGLVPNLGVNEGQKATWIGASGDRTFIKVDEALISPQMLQQSLIFATRSVVGILPHRNNSAQHCMLLSRNGGTCHNFTDSNQQEFTNCCICIDPIYNLLWSYDSITNTIQSYSPLKGVARALPSLPESASILSPELSFPTQHQAPVSSYQVALNIIGCLDTLSASLDAGLTVEDSDPTLQEESVQDARLEDFNFVNRFEGYGGGWGYSGHSIEAVRFSADTDIVLGGFGLFGGRGEYTAKIKLIELGTLKNGFETEGEVKAESEEKTYECGAKEEFPILFDEPVHVTGGVWYLAWARIIGPSSDCGSGGQSFVTTEDKVTFQFAGSRKSNNGTDVNAGQIPKLYYRLPGPEAPIRPNMSKDNSQVHILSDAFCRTVTPEAFESLLLLLQWSWSTLSRKVDQISQAQKDPRQDAEFLQDISGIAYICTACLRLVRSFICEIFPSPASDRKPRVEQSDKLPECISSTCKLLRQILEGHNFSLNSGTNLIDKDEREETSLAIARHQEDIIQECHNTFVQCFHAFCPTSQLKWIFFCELLNLYDEEENTTPSQGLLSAVLGALCNPCIKLTRVLPLLKSQDPDSAPSIPLAQVLEEASPVGVEMDRSSLTVELVSHMQEHMKEEQLVALNTNFQEVLDKLLQILVNPIRQALDQKTMLQMNPMLTNTSNFLACVVGELASLTNTSEGPHQMPSRPLLTTPSRFTKTSQTYTWSTGNGTPDAICLMVDKPGIQIAGICVYGGGGQYTYEMELLDAGEGGSDSHAQRWNSLEFARGVFGGEEGVDRIVEVKFDKPVPVKDNVKYAIRLRLHGNKTLSGDLGLTQVKCPDGVTFAYSSCTLSSNGTSLARGQIPQILYYSSHSSDNKNSLPESKSAEQEYQARKSLFATTETIVRQSNDILLRALCIDDTIVPSILQSSPLFSHLLPLTLAYMGPVAVSNPKSTVETLSLIRELLPQVCTFNSVQAPPSLVPSNLGEISSVLWKEGSEVTTSPHYVVVESEHPYPPATACFYKVSFPSSVQWMSLEFDPQCGMAQPEDSLQLYIRGCDLHTTETSAPITQQEGLAYWPVMDKIHGKNKWPTSAVILPGNEVVFSLCTASDYLKDEKANRFGFKCTVVGFEQASLSELGLVQLEKELSFLGGMCSAALLKKDIPLAFFSLEGEDEVEPITEAAQEIFNTHGALLGQGFALTQPITIQQALDGHLPLQAQSTERAFLLDFVHSTSGTSGGRLARWFQPESYVEPKQCEVILPKTDINCGIPTQLIIHSRDQYGALVIVPNLKVEVEAVPVGSKQQPDYTASFKTDAASSTEKDLTFGGLSAPKMSTPYQPTLRRESTLYTSITMMKEYESYSFEELRLASMPISRPNETMLVRDNQDGSFIANWTPSAVGFYSVRVKVDGHMLDDSTHIEVADPPQGTIPPSVTPKKQTAMAKMRKFVMKHSSGLRIRSSPSLQSEAIGVVEVDGVVAFTEEVHNNDGVWVRLTFDSIKKFSPDNGHHKEGWCLQYNQHIGKTLLVPLEEPKSLFSEVAMEEPVLKPEPPKGEEVVAAAAKIVGGPGIYSVINCGPSGHNIRCRASLKASAIGMMVHGNTLGVVEDVHGSDGSLWVKLDKDTISHYCEGNHAEAWALACHKGETYIVHESEFPSADEVESLKGSSIKPKGGGAIGFDFKDAQGPPHLEFSLKGKVPAFGGGMANGFISEDLANHDNGEEQKKLKSDEEAAKAEESQRNANISPAKTWDDVLTSSEDSTTSTPVRSTYTSPQKLASHFTIGSGEVSPKHGVSPKLGRRQRPVGRRSRSSSPAGKEGSPAKTRPITLKQESKEKAKPAVATSVSECTRAVFAAFLWHEGLVHDAMACASYLKFNSSLTKKMASVAQEDKRPTNKKELKLKNRHSMDLSKSIKTEDFPGNRFESNLNREEGTEIAKKDSASGVLPESINANSALELRDRASSVGAVHASKDDSGVKESKPKTVVTIPVTLKSLLGFWEEIASATYDIASQSLVLPSPVPMTKTRNIKTSDVKDIPRPKEPKGKKRRDRHVRGGGRGNLFGEAAGPPLGLEKHETVCEMCYSVFPRPVTYHMKQAHPGCGKMAGGYGYNSSGHYCGGWAGNCGDGGMAGSSWYLMCMSCRSRYIQERQEKNKEKEKSKKQKKKLPPIKTPKVIPPLEAHHVMRANAMFLLDLASSAGHSFPKRSPCMKMRRFDMPAVKESVTPSPENPFPVVPFQFLKNSPSLPEDLGFEEAVHQAGYGFPSISQSVPLVGLSASNNEEGFKGDTSKKTSYQRSVSMMATNDSQSKVRRRNISGSTDDGSSLIRRPSPRLATLVEEGFNGCHVLHRAVMLFIVQHHDLEGLKLAMKQALCKAACKIHALQAFNWLLRSATQPVCIHDLLWHFVVALCPSSVEKETEEDEKQKDDNKDKEIQEAEKDSEGLILEHPLEDILLSEDAINLLPITFHDLLQTISNLMVVLPQGGALQQMALQCWSMKFRTSDHVFLHQSHVFSNINRILSKSDENECDDGTVSENSQKSLELSPVHVEELKDIMNSMEVEVSSRAIMVGCLTDGSTETFWESGDEDRNKTKTITLKVKDGSTPKVVAVHIDNSRDVRNKVNMVTLSAGSHTGNLTKFKQSSLDAKYAGWLTCNLERSERSKFISIELRGPDSHLRVRQVKVLGHIEGLDQSDQPIPASALQQQNCITEALRVFRLLTSQVFGKLLADQEPNSDGKISPEGKPVVEEGDEGDPDLREHMVGILFSRSKLTNLQKQVCSHIVLAIHKEAIKMKEGWENSLSVTPTPESAGASPAKHVEPTVVPDAYCFELLSMVLALSFSGVGRAYVAQQKELLQDLLSLLHTGSPRVQRQVISILRKVLPEISPKQFAHVQGVSSLPSSELVLFSKDSEKQTLQVEDNLGILDVFLACIAKALVVQVKSKGIGGSKTPQSLTVAKLINESMGDATMVAAAGGLGGRWYLNGSMSTNLAEQIISLIKDMSKGVVSAVWADVTRGAIAELVLSLTRVSEDERLQSSCLPSATLWLCLASLCVLEPDHVERLSNSKLTKSKETASSAETPFCDNHEDGVTLAIISCNECQNLCGDCDRILHLPKVKRNHFRKVFKDEEDSIKVDLHEGCGRSKLYWITALADSKTLKAMVEFKEISTGKSMGSSTQSVCRFCGNQVASSSAVLMSNVCSDSDCQKFAKTVCSKTLPCGHLCGGIKDESVCLPCLHGCSRDGTLKQDSEDMCMICFTEALSCAPSLQLECGHVFHQHCCKEVLDRRWVGPRITFGFTLCPICKGSISHKSLREELTPIQALEADVRKKALMRLEYEGLHQCEAITTPGARYHSNPAGFAMNRYAYYVCFKCKKAYYGGEARCDQEAGVGASEDYNPAELICGGCSDVSRAQLCPKHGTDYLEYKCRYCCSVAVYFCFGTTHFCNPCHDNFQRITNMSRTELPHCPAGPGAVQLEGDECPLHVEHPPTGEEFALGCGICRNTHTF